MADEEPRFTVEVLDLGVRLRAFGWSHASRRARDREYVNACVDVLDTDYDSLLKWVTRFCPECEELIEAEDRNHLTHEGIVLIGCEGYWVISPKALGLNPGNWQDWT